jgi:hypothetical protein
MVATISSCKKEGIPNVDTIPPNMTLQISGGGFNKTFVSTEDYSLGQLNMKPLTKYRFTLTISDTGGVKSLELRLPTLFSAMTVNGVPMVAERTTSTTKYYTINTPQDTSEYYKSYLMTGEFVTPDAANTSYALGLLALGRDFKPNLTSLSINLDISDIPVGGYGWVLF